MLDIENAFGDGCQHANSLALQLSASQVVFVTAGGCRLPTTLRLCLTRMSPLPDHSPEPSWGEGQHQAVSTSWDCLGHLPWEPATSSLPSRNTQPRTWAELRLPSTGQASPIHHEAPTLAAPQQLQRCKKCSTAHHIQRKSQF